MSEHGEPRVCAWCNERVKQGEPCVNSPSEQVGRAYRYFHEWCYGLHEHQRAEAAEAKLAELREAAQSVVDRLRLATEALDEIESLGTIETVEETRIAREALVKIRAGEVGAASVAAEAAALCPHGPAHPQAGATTTKEGK